MQLLSHNPSNKLCLGNEIFCSNTSRLSLHHSLFKSQSSLSYTIATSSQQDRVTLSDLNIASISVLQNKSPHLYGNLGNLLKYAESHVQISKNGGMC